MKMKLLYILPLAILSLVSCVGNHVGYPTADTGVEFYVNKSPAQLNDVAVFSVMYNGSPVSEGVQISYKSADGASSGILEDSYNKFVCDKAGEYTFQAKLTVGEEELTSEEIKLTVLEPKADATPLKKVSILYCTDESCKNCPTMAKIVKAYDHENPNSIVVTAIHRQDFLKSPEQTALLGHFGITADPALILDMDKNVVIQSAYEQVVTKKINDRKSTPADCALGIETTLSGEELTVKVNYDNRKAQEYKLIVVLVEDNIKAREQVGISGDYYHQNVIRAFMTNELGDSIGTLEAGQGTKDGYKVTMNSEWNKENCRVETLLLSKQSGDVYVVNNVTDCYVGYTSPCQYVLE